MKLILITGMSGAGKGVALRALEDIGYEAMDNLPLSLIEDVLHKRPNTNLAIDIDVRNREFSTAQFLKTVGRLRVAEHDVVTLYLDCDDEVLRKRYTETRRPHPLANDKPVMDGIRLERDLIEPLKSHADVTIDTSETSVNDLRRIVSGHFNATQKTLGVYVTSFSFRHGVPREADLVLDVRFLRNPHYIEHLKPQTGLDPDVGTYIAADADFAAFFERLTALILPLLPRYKEEGKRYLTIAIGCTGGKHRSVYVTEQLGKAVKEAGYDTTIHHRDIARV